MILQNDFRREPADLRRRMDGAIERVLNSGWYILGEEVRCFEGEWARYLRAEHCIGVGNGLDALEIGLRASGVKSGDEVITTPMTAFATVLAIMRCGGVPVFADIEKETGNIDVASIRRCITERTRGVLAVHLYGQMCNMEKLVQVCQEYQIELWEDCAQAHGANWNGQAAGTWGRWSGFSFYPTKNLGAVGDGGAIVTSDAEIDTAARLMRNYGQSDRYRHVIAGMNSRLDEIQAALLRERLLFLSVFNERRREVAEMYRSLIDNEHIRVLAAPPQRSSHVYHLFVITCRYRAQLSEYLRSCGVQPQVHYPIPAHLQRPASGCPIDPAGLLETELHAATCLSLPCNPQLDDDEVHAVIERVNLFSV